MLFTFCSVVATRQQRLQTILWYSGFQREIVLTFLSVYTKHCLYECVYCVKHNGIVFWRRRRRRRRRGRRRGRGGEGEEREEEEYEDRRKVKRKPRKKEQQKMHQKQIEEEGMRTRLHVHTQYVDSCNQCVHWVYMYWALLRLLWLIPLTFNLTSTHVSSEAGFGVISFTLYGRR